MKTYSISKNQIGLAAVSVGSTGGLGFAPNAESLVQNGRISLERGGVLAVTVPHAPIYRKKEKIFQIFSERSDLKKFAAHFQDTRVSEGNSGGKRCAIDILLQHPIQGCDWPTRLRHYRHRQPRQDDNQDYNRTDIPLRPFRTNRPPQNQTNSENSQAQHKRDHSIFFGTQECCHAMRRAIGHAYQLEENPLQEGKNYNRRYQTIPR